MRPLGSSLALCPEKTESNKTVQKIGLLKHLSLGPLGSSLALCPEKTESNKTVQKIGLLKHLSPIHLQLMECLGLKV